MTFGESRSFILGGLLRLSTSAENNYTMSNFTNQLRCANHRHLTRFAAETLRQYLEQRQPLLVELPGSRDKPPSRRLESSRQGPVVAAPLDDLASTLLFVATCAGQDMRPWSRLVSSRRRRSEGLVCGNNRITVRGDRRLFKI